MMKDEIRSKILNAKHFRTMKVERAEADAKTETIPMTFSSDYPVVRWWGVEVLSHDPEAVELERWKSGAPFLFDHCTDDQRGIIENGDLVDGILKGDVRMSRNPAGQELKNDITDGIRPYTSVGYDIRGLKMIEPEEMDDTVKNLCLENNCDAYRVTRWVPLEGSSVWLGANPGVGVGRDYSDGLEQAEITELLKKAKEERKNQTPTITIQERAETMPEPKTPEQIAQAEAERKRDIEAIGKKFEGRIAGGKDTMDQLVKDAIELERSVSEFKGSVYLRINDGEPIETPASFLDLSKADKKRYSLMAAIRRQVDGVGGEFEKEVSDAIAKRTNSEGNVVGLPKKGGLYVPYDAQRRELDFSAIPPGFERELVRVLGVAGVRALSAGGATAGQTLVGTEHRPQDFITLLRAKLIQGITYLSGLSSNVDIPKQTGGATISVAATEGGNYTETAPVFGQITLSPHDIGGFVEITRRLLIQSTPSVDALVMSDLAQQLALKMNYLALYGSGASGEPLGIFNTPNIGTVNGVDLSWPSLLEFISDIGTANVSGELNWLGNSVMQVLLMGRAKEAGYPIYLMGDDGKAAGKTMQVTEQMGEGDLALVKPDEIVVGEFGMMEIVQDRNTNSSSGGLRIAIYHSMDSALKHPGAVSFADSVS